jgi:hypothetical protein
MKNAQLNRSIQMQCETCSTEIPTVEDAHSMMIVLQRVTLVDGYSYYQCDSGTEYGGLTYQHFHCSHDEMLDGVRICINEHYDESLLIPVSPEQVRLHKTVFKAHIRCKVCGTPLQTKAYRFCLTHATPHNSVPDDSMNELSEWCCSLAHAQQSALSILEE